MRFFLKEALTFIFGALIFIFSLFYHSAQNYDQKFQIEIFDFPLASGVCPHHLLAKDLIEKFFQYLSSKGEPETLILLAPDHFNQKVLCKTSSFITVSYQNQTFQDIAIDNKLLEDLKDKFSFCFNDSYVKKDHAISNLLFYIKSFLPKTKILPILIPNNISEDEIKSLVETISEQKQKSIFILASVDFSHYLPPEVASFHDIKSIRTVLNFENENFRNLDVDCWQCLYGARLFAKLKEKEKPKIIGYKNSIEFSKNKELSETTSCFSVVFEKGEFKKEKNPITLLFVGDIMLDRGVEYLMKKNNFLYPFEKIESFLRGIDFVIGNLEGPIVENPPDFGPKSLQFAFSPKVVSALSFSHFNLLSLANNHTFDVGKKGFEQTKEILKNSKIDFVGHPLTCKEDSFFEKEDLIFLAFNKTFPFNCSDKEIIEIVKETKNLNPEKFLIVIFHWGEEYQPKSSLSQRKLAHALIDAGADLIVGHHPHVVQEIEKYNGKLIFYSLGNFIFDQFFSKETQESLAVGIEIYPQKVVYNLFPLESKMAQPSLMGASARTKFLENLAKKSDQSLAKEILQGKIEVERIP